MARQGQGVKFALSTEFDLSVLVREFQKAGWRAHRGRLAAVTGEVIDTPERELLSAGIAVIQEGSGRGARATGWVVPLKGGAVPRELFRVSGATGGLALTVLSKAHIRVNGSLTALGRFRKKTIPIELESRAGRVRVTLETLAPADGGGGKTRGAARRPRTAAGGGEGAISILALEVVRGDSDTLSLVSGLTQLQPGVSGRVENGPRRVLELLGLRSGPVITAKVAVTGHMSAGEAAVEILRRDYANVLANEAGARAGLDEEFLHDMRVATRRLREALRIFADVFAEGAADHVTEEIKWLASVLGAVRDLDVYIAKVPEYLSCVEGAAPDYTFYIDALREQRRPLRQALVAALDGVRYSAFKREMEAFLAEPPVAEKASSLRSMARRRLKSIAKKALDAANGARTDEELHAARIAFKRCRYAAEFVRNLAPKQMGKLAREAVEYQDILGAHQDATVACARVRAELDHEKADRVRAFLLGYLFACQKLSAIDSKEKFVKRWKAGGAKEFAGAVKAALGSL